MKKVVNDLNLSVEKGDYLCIVGENGSGKSTFVKALLGILKPAGGEIVFDGSVSKSLATFRSKLWCREISRCR